MSSELVLIVDDEPNILELVCLYLERDNFQVATAKDGLAALEAVRQFHPDLVILDVMLPELDGFEVCRRLRSENVSTPILMLSARDEDIDKILGLELGADDYLTKPFNPREMIARVKAILRRKEHTPEATANVLRVGSLVIDIARREVSCGSQQIDLRTQEFEVLLVLAQNPGFVINREKMLLLAWGYDFPGQTRTVDVHIAQIRRKLARCSQGKPGTQKAVRIETVTGIGYKLVA